MDANSVNKPLCQCGWGQLGECQAVTDRSGGRELAFS